MTNSTLITCLDNPFFGPKWLASSIGDKEWYKRGHCQEDNRVGEMMVVVVVMMMLVVDCDNVDVGDHHYHHSPLPFPIPPRPF